MAICCGAGAAGLVAHQRPLLGRSLSVRSRCAQVPLPASPTDLAGEAPPAEGAAGAAAAQLAPWVPFVRALTLSSVLLYVLHHDARCIPAADIDIWARGLALGSIAVGCFPELIRTMLGYEAGRRHDLSRAAPSPQRCLTFLRQTSLVSRTLDVVAREHLRPFVRFVAGPAVDAASRAGADSSAQLVGELLRAFTDRLGAAPCCPELGAVCAACAEIAAACPEHMDPAPMIGAFVMLRCLTCAVAVPERYGLTDAPPSPAARAALVPLSRALQKAANASGVFGEGDPLESLNAVLAEVGPQLRLALLRLSTPEAGGAAEQGAAPAPPQQAAEACAELRGAFLRAHSGLRSALGAQLPACPAAEVLGVVEDALPTRVPSKRLSSAAPPPPAAAPEDQRLQELVAAASRAACGRSKCAAGLRLVRRMDPVRPLGPNNEGVHVVLLHLSRLPQAVMGAADPCDDACVLQFVRCTSRCAAAPYRLAVLTAAADGALRLRPAIQWLLRLYERALPKCYRDNLRGIHLLRPPLWLKGLFRLFQPLLAWRGLGGVSNAASLTQLLAELGLPAERFPLSVDAALALPPGDAGAACSPEGLALQCALALRAPRLDHPEGGLSAAVWSAATAPEAAQTAAGVLQAAQQHTLVDLTGLPEQTVLAVLLAAVSRHPGGGLLHDQTMELCAAAAELLRTPGDPPPERREEILTKVATALQGARPATLALLEHICALGCNNPDAAAAVAPVLFAPGGGAGTPPQGLAVAQLLLEQPVSGEWWAAVWRRRNKRG